MASAGVVTANIQAPDQQGDLKKQQQDQTSSGTDQPKEINGKQVIATKIAGKVKWFNVKNGYGFIHREDVNEDIFIHQTAIIKNNPEKFLRSVGENEDVEFDVVRGEKGLEAANVTGPNGSAVQGSKYAADRRRFSNQGGPRRSRPPFRGSRGRPRGGYNPGFNRPFDGAYGPPPPPMVGRPSYGRPPRGMVGPIPRGGRPPFRGGYGYDDEFLGHGPRIYRGRPGPMIGGPMGPFPGPMGPPLGYRYRGGPRPRGRFIRGARGGNRGYQNNNYNEDDQVDEQDAN